MIQKILNTVLLGGAVMLSGTSWSTSPKQVRQEIKHEKLSDQNQKDLSSHQLQFGLNLFQDLVKESGTKENVFISPLSIALALQMAYNGADGTTKDEMAACLDLQGIALDDLNRTTTDLMTSLGQADPKVTLNIAQSIWLKQGIDFVPSFLDACRTAYQAEVNHLTTVDPINAWVNDHTKKKITKILDRISPDDIAVLLNAIYFKGTWTKEFEKKDTREEPFTLVTGHTKRHPLMSRHGYMSYLETDAFQSVKLPYGSKRFNMVIMLPKTTAPLTTWMASITPDQWIGWRTKFDNQEGLLKLPKFKIEYERSLVEPLKHLGMKSAFGAADFSRMVPGRGVFISKVIHKTYVDVNEEGTEAAAVTAVMMDTSESISRPFSMIVNRPFVCAIQDDITGALLFLGLITEPK